jgi:anti-sigma regulatory factor (Ser/Thr protein kinase)
MLAALDERLSESLRPGVFVTMCYAVLDPASGRLTFASAGHNPLLLWRCVTGRTETCASKGIPLGAIRGGAIRATLRDETVQLAPGDVCLQFTDGYTEAFQDGSGEPFGLERVREVLELNAARGGEAVRRALRDAIRTWSGEGVPDDDETLLLLTYDAAPDGARAPQSANDTDTRPANDTDAGTAVDAEARTAVEELERARRRGHGLELDARLERLDALGAWARGLPELEPLPRQRLEVVGAALYEVCANIVEHGCGEDGRPGLEVWWLPTNADAPPDASTLGRFVIRDDGRPFRPNGRRPTDFNDPAVRARGRGIGLEIIHRAMADVSYHPSTPQGNITVLALGCEAPQASEEGMRR